MGKLCSLDSTHVFLGRPLVMELHLALHNCRDGIVAMTRGYLSGKGAVTKAYIYVQFYDLRRADHATGGSFEGKHVLL